ncbi:M23 family metallopeptidase [Streptomyces sp. NPDC001668]|uniref:M23 family metallopeptidase n=1 Tax=unclassified Streptomyces TaxID=2593676 RepID=UPI00369591BB
MTTLYKPFRGTYGIVRGFTGSDYRRHHTGVDYRTPRHTPVLASAAGTVVKSVDLTYSYGRYVIVAHGGGLFTLYAHLDRRLVATGTKVAAGQRIGLSGSTGNSSGPHLHFEVRKGRNGSGATVDPLPLLKGNPPVVAMTAEAVDAAEPGMDDGFVLAAPDHVEVGEAQEIDLFMRCGEPADMAVEGGEPGQ